MIPQIPYLSFRLSEPGFARQARWQWAFLLCRDGLTTKIGA
jgi:hypothetical protein